MPTPILENKRIIVVKPESVAGLDAEPDATFGMYCESLTVKKMNVKKVERAVVRPHFGAQASVSVSWDATIEIGVALSTGGNSAGVPVAGLPPGCDALWRGCGMSKTTLASEIAGTAQGGNLSSIILASGASASDGAYEGLSIATVMASGTAQAPGGAAKTTLKLKSTDNMLAASLRASSTDTVLNFATTSSGDDEFYVGMEVIVDGVVRTITAYDGATQQATLSSALPSAPGAIAYAVRRPDDFFKGMIASIVHFAGNIKNTATSPSTRPAVYLPKAVVGTNNLAGLLLKVTTGSNPTEIVKIKAYDTVTQKATLSPALAILPTSASTFEVIQHAKITSSAGSTTREVYFAPLKFETSSSTDYEIYEHRLVTAYDGTTKRATVTPAFKSAPTTEATYIIPPYVKYSPISTDGISNSIYFYEDGALHVFTYARGTATGDFNNGELPMTKFSYTGLLERYENAALPAFNIKWVDPLPVNYINTESLVVHDYPDAVLDKFSFDLGNKIVHHNAPGADVVYIEGRECKGNLSIWATKPSEKDFYEAVSNDDLGVVALSHGPIGNRISVFCKSAQLLDPSDSPKDGIVMLGMGLSIQPVGTGNNEIAIIYQ